MTHARAMFTPEVTLYLSLLAMTIPTSVARTLVTTMLPSPAETPLSKLASS